MRRNSLVMVSLLISTKSKETTRDLKFGCISDGMEDVGLRFGGTGGW